MPTTLAYAEFKDILLAIVARLRDELQLTEHNGRLVVDPDNEESAISGGLWLTIAPKSGRFVDSMMDAGRATLGTDTGVGVRINTNLKSDPIGADEELLCDSSYGIPAAMTKVLDALSLEWMPTYPDGEGMLRQPMRPVGFDFGKGEDVGYVEIQFSVLFDWDLGER
jgi:hypothetical protein